MATEVSELADRLEAEARQHEARASGFEKRLQDGDTMLSLQQPASERRLARDLHEAATLIRAISQSRD